MTTIHEESNKNTDLYCQCKKNPIKKYEEI